MENVEILLFMEMNYWFDKERTIIYRMYEDSPGMIYYEFRYKDAERQKEYERSYFGLQTELEEDTEKLLIRTLMLSIIATGTTLEINEALVNGLFFLLIPQFELDSIKQRYTGGCQAAA